MSDFLLNHFKNNCPKCLTRRTKQTGFCHNCDTKLFAHDDYDFSAFEFDTGNMNWWAWHKLDGWKHRDHYMVDGAKANHRKYVAPILPKDYGRTTTPDEVANAPRKLASKKMKLVA